MAVLRFGELPEVWQLVVRLAVFGFVIQMIQTDLVVVVVLVYAVHVDAQLPKSARLAANYHHQPMAELDLITAKIIRITLFATSSLH